MSHMSCRASSERVRVGEDRGAKIESRSSFDYDLTDNIHRPFAKDAIEYVEWGERRTAVFTRINNHRYLLMKS